MIMFIYIFNDILFLGNSSFDETEWHTFKFNKVFTQDTKQDEIFYSITPLIQTFLDGYPICIISYGPTGMTLCAKLN